jgi:Major Facilitator Superfamily
MTKSQIGPCFLYVWKTQEEVKWPKVSSKVSSKRYMTLSAGTKPSNKINPLVVEVMKEVGIDISNQKSKEITEATFGLKPFPFYLGIAFALLGLLISFFVVKYTRKFTLLEIKEQEKKNNQDETIKTTVTTKSNLSSPPTKGDRAAVANPSFMQVFLITSWKNRSLLSVSQAGLVNNLIFGVTWGLFTIYFASIGFSVSDIAFMKALHPGIWGALQLVTGTLSDKVGRKILIYPGMIVQGIGVWIVLLSANSFIGIIIGMSFLGIGTALVYPTLLAAISDVASPKWRATSLGVYRFWRDLGFVFGAIGVGFIADLSSNSIAIQLVAWIATASGIFVLFIMKETRKV